MTSSNSLSNYPRTFFDCLDQESRIECLFVNKELNQYVSHHLLADLKMQPIKGVSAYSQVMLYYRRHCDYFRRKVPSLFGMMPLSTVLNDKQLLDILLKSPGTKPNITTITQIWRNFIGQFQFGKDPFSYLPYEVTNAFLSDPNEEAQLLIRAGTSFNQVAPWDVVFNPLNTVISKKWSREDTVQLLLQSKIKVTARTVGLAIESNRFDHMLPALFRSLKPCTKQLAILLEVVPLQHQAFVDKYIDRLATVGRSMISLALKKNYSEDVVIKLLSKCPKGAYRYHIRVAIENRYSEHLILSLMNKCQKHINQYYIRLALEGQYSEPLVLGLLNKYPHGIDQYYIQIAIERQYSEHLILSLLNKCPMGVDEEIIYLGTSLSIQLLENFLDKCYLTTLDFRRSTQYLRLLIKLKHDRDRLIFCIRLVPPAQMRELLEILLNTGRFNAIIDLFLDQDVVVKEIDIHKALDQQYPEEIVIKLIHRVEEVSLDLVRKVKQMHCSPAIVLLVKTKYTVNRSCITM